MIHDGKLFVTGNDIASDDSTGVVQIRGNGLVVDTGLGTSVFANNVIHYNKKTDALLATKKPLMIIKQDEGLNLHYCRYTFSVLASLIFL